MRFGSPRDYSTILSFNRELVNEVADVNVIIYKINNKETAVNIYGESTSRVKYTPVQVPCLLDRGLAMTERIMGTLGVEQETSFAFLRYELEQRDVYPEIGDLIFFDNQHYEINLTNEIQFFAGQEKYNHGVLCRTHIEKIDE